MLLFFFSFFFFYFFLRFLFPPSFAKSGQGDYYVRSNRLNPIEHRAVSGGPLTEYQALQGRIGGYDCGDVRGFRDEALLVTF